MSFTSELRSLERLQTFEETHHSLLQFPGHLCLRVLLLKSLVKLAKDEFTHAIHETLMLLVLVSESFDEDDFQLVDVGSLFKDRLQR